MFDLFEGGGPLANGQIFEQFGRPDRIRGPVAGSDNAAQKFAVQEEIIGARRKLYEAVGHHALLADLICISIHS